MGRMRATYPGLGLDSVLVVDVAAEANEVEVLPAEGAVVGLRPARLHQVVPAGVRVVEPHIQICAATNQRAHSHLSRIRPPASQIKIKTNRKRKHNQGGARAYRSATAGASRRRRRRTTRRRRCHPTGRWRPWRGIERNPRPGWLGFLPPPSFRVVLVSSFRPPFLALCSCVSLGAGVLCMRRACVVLCR
jgi:hypothetical protein